MPVKLQCIHTCECASESILNTGQYLTEVWSSCWLSFRGKPATSSLSNKIGLIASCRAIQQYAYTGHQRMLQHRRRISVNFGGMTFVPENYVRKMLTPTPNFTWYYPGKIIKMPEFLWYLPEKCLRFYMIIAEKYFSWFFLRGGGARASPVPRLLRLCATTVYKYLLVLLDVKHARILHMQFCT